MKIGSDKNSGLQMDLLQRAQRGPREVAAEAFLRIIRDPDVRREDEELHPDWLSAYERVWENVSSRLPPGSRKEVESFFDALQSFDSQLAKIEVANLRTTFLLGAGASKPAPSGIPTVKELLPQLLAGC